MTQSNRKKLINKDKTSAEITDILPLERARELVWEYALDQDYKEDTQRYRLFAFFDSPGLEKEILYLVDHAGPLDTIESYIRKAHARKESHLPDTLLEATSRAIKNLDHNIQTEHTKELTTTRLDGHQETKLITTFGIIEGLAEKLLNLHAELFPSTYAEALTRARLAAPIEEEKIQSLREKENFEVIKKIYNAFITGENIRAATAHLQQVLQFEDNRHALNVINLMICCLRILAENGIRLPLLPEEKAQLTKGKSQVANEEQRFDGLYGKHARDFCIHIFGLIETFLPHRIRQIIKTGISVALKGLALPNRRLDLDVTINSYDSLAYRIGGQSIPGCKPFLGPSLWPVGGGPDGIAMHVNNLQNLLQVITASASEMYGIAPPESKPQKK